VSQEPLPILNFLHPLTDAQRDQVAQALGVTEIEEIHILVQIGPDASMSDQIARYVDQVGWDGRAWQTRAFCVSPPGLAPAACALFAEIEGRSGHLPDYLWFERDPASAVTRYRLREVIAPESIREAARTRRGTADLRTGESVT